MASFNQMSKFVFRLLHLPPRIGYALGLGSLIGNFVLLLTTIGRKSGKPRITPLQYEEIDGRIYLGAALGQKADWVRNIQANPRVEVQVKSRRFSGTAELITDSRQIADFLEVRIHRHPWMIGAILRAEGLQIPPEHSALERYAEQLTMVVITPDTGSTNGGGIKTSDEIRNYKGYWQPHHHLRFDHYPKNYYRHLGNYCMLPIGKNIAPIMEKKL